MQARGRECSHTVGHRRQHRVPGSPHRELDERTDIRIIVGDHHGWAHLGAQRVRVRRTSRSCALVNGLGNAVCAIG